MILSESIINNSLSGRLATLGTRLNMDESFRIRGGDAVSMTARA